MIIALALTFVTYILVVSATIGLLIWRNTYAMSCLRTRQQKGEALQVCISHEHCSCSLRNCICTQVIMNAKLSHTKTAHVGGARDGHRSSAPSLRECSPSLMGHLPGYAVHAINVFFAA